jgi:hypothetical protein
LEAYYRHYFSLFCLGLSFLSASRYHLKMSGFTCYVSLGLDVA